MVFAAIAQSFAFSYKEFVTSSKSKTNMFHTIGNVLNVKDVITDAHSTFMNDEKKSEEEVEST